MGDIRMVTIERKATIYLKSISQGSKKLTAKISLLYATSIGETPSLFLVTSFGCFSSRTVRHCV